MPLNTPPAIHRLRVLTVNTHKGFTALNRRFILPELREAVRVFQSDGPHDFEQSRANEKEPRHVRYLEAPWPGACATKVRRKRASVRCQASFAAASS